MRNYIMTLLSCVLAYGCSNNTETDKTPNKILFVVSNQHFYKNTDLNTSNHFAEIVLAYDVFAKAGYEVDFVSPKGGAVPIGYINTSNEIQKKYLYDAGFMDLLQHTHGPSAITPSNYKAVYYSGGGAAMFGISENEKIQKIAMDIYKNNGVLSAICHGTAGIVNLKTEDGLPVYKGKKVTGFPDAFENKTADYYQTFPFSIEDAINKNDGDFRYSEKGWDGFYLIDGRLVTGQDPSASIIVAQNVIRIIKNNN